MNPPTQPTTATATHTPYENARNAYRSTRFSPDGFIVIEEFSNGQRFCHNPVQGFPVQLAQGRPWPEVTIARAKSSVSA